MSTSSAMQAGFGECDHHVSFTCSTQSIKPVRSHSLAVVDWSLNQLKNFAFSDMPVNGSILIITLLINQLQLFHGFADQETQLGIVNWDKLSHDIVLQCFRCKHAQASFLL